MSKKGKTEALKALDIAASISAVTKEKSISMELVLDSLKDALTTAARKYLGTPTNVEAKVDRDKGTIEVFTRQVVVAVIEDPEMQISIEDARALDEEVEIGDEIVQDLDIEQFGRMAIQTAKQVIIQRVREAEREKIYSDYSDRVGELITGTVQQIEKGNILVNLGRTEALLPYREQIRKEHYRQGDNIRASILEVKNNPKGPQVIVSRTCPEFLARLFELEVPEIFDKTVRIVKVVRDPGHRSKIAVSTNDSRVDPVGACVGMRGNRVQAIVRELSNERIDIVNWTEELSLLVRRVFSPAEVKRVIPVDEYKIVVVISEEDLAQAIGREGQNIRLASKMLDREIDVFGDEEFSSMTESEKNSVLRTGPEVPTNEEEAVADEVSTDEVEQGDESSGDNDTSDESSGDNDTSDESSGDNDTSDDGTDDDDTLIVDSGVGSEGEAEDDPVMSEIANEAIDSLSKTDKDAEDAIDEAHRQADNT